MVGRRCTATAATFSAGAVVAAPLFWGWGAAPLPTAPLTGNPVAAAQGFNAISLEDTRLANTESEGPIAVGGDLSFGGDYRVVVYDAGSFTDPADDPATPVGLLVGGRLNLEGSSGTLSLLEGYAKIGDPAGVEVIGTDANGADVFPRIVVEGEGYDSSPSVALNTLQSAESVMPKPGLIDFQDAFDRFGAYSSGLALCENAIRLTTADGEEIDPEDIPEGADVHVYLGPGQNVLNLSAATFVSLAELTFEDPPSASSPLVINVDTSDSGGVFDWSSAPLPAGAGALTAPYTLWNFPGASQVVIPAGVDTVEGTVYAPTASVEHYSAANIEGTVVSRSFTQSSGGPVPPAGMGQGSALAPMELHYRPFAAQLTTCETGPAPSASPSPSPSEPGPDPSPSPEPSPSPSAPVAPRQHPVPPEQPRLPVTGASVVASAVAGLVAVSAGAAALIIGRDRRDREE